MVRSVLFPGVMHCTPVGRTLEPGSGCKMAVRGVEIVFQGHVRPASSRRPQNWSSVLALRAHA